MMNPKEIIMAELDMLGDTFIEQLEVAKNHPNQIPVIELDLMKQSIRTIYQRLHDLSKYQDKASDASIKQPVEVPVAITSVPQVEEKIKIVEPEPIKELKAPEIVEAKIETVIPAEIKAEKIVVEEPVTFQNVEKMEALQPKNEKRIEVIKEQKAKTLFDDHIATVAEKFNHEESIYDRLSKNTQAATVADSIVQEPVEHLHQSIGINERFAFINELFGGDAELYASSIKHLDSLPNYEEARFYLHGELADLFFWNKQSSAFLKLSGLLKRKWS
jgi:hypothetical protein